MMLNNYNVFCTLFNSKYLDKGLLLYRSLSRTCKQFKLYVFAFDKLAFDVLSDMKLDNMVVISLDEFENEELLRVKKQRSSAEYCWTCTPFTIDYVFEKYHEEICTYIDADMCFYSEPDQVFKEMVDNSKSIIIVGHRFPKKTAEKEEKVHGKYCVEFNTFVNDASGRSCLEWWRKSCLEKCHYSRKQNECVGDQTYLEEFEKKFDGVLSSSVIGAGVAPWNTANYCFSRENGRLMMKDSDVKTDVVFFHFQNVRYLPFGLININSGTSSSFVKNEIYRPYLTEIEEIRDFLKDRYDITFSFKKSTYRNRFLAFLQNYVLPFKVRHFNNIIKIRMDKK